MGAKKNRISSVNELYLKLLGDWLGQAEVRRINAADNLSFTSRRLKEKENSPQTPSNTAKAKIRVYSFKTISIVVV